MNFGQAIRATCALGTIALVSPTAANAATTVAYITSTSSTVTPACTTKDAQRPTDAQRANVPSDNKWYMSAPQSQMTTRMPRGQNVNDFPSPINMFPTVFQQPRDKDKNGQTPPLTVSTCQNKA